MRGQIVQWKGDNVEEVRRLLNQHLIHAERQGETLVLRGIGVSATTAEPGDTIMLDGDRMGIMRHTTAKPLTENSITWDNNPEAFWSFAQTYQLTITVFREQLRLYAGEQAVIVLERGDRLIQRDGQIIVSKLGKDHRG